MARDNDPQARLAITEMLVMLAENFGATPGDAWLAGTVAMLEQYPLDRVREGMHRVLRNRKFKSMPTVAELLDAVEGSREDLERLLAAQAWGAAVVAISQCEARVMDRAEAQAHLAANLDPVALVVVRNLGGPDLLRQDLARAGLTFRERDFVAQYQAYLRSGSPETEALLSTASLRELGSSAIRSAYISAGGPARQLWGG